MAITAVLQREKIGISMNGPGARRDNMFVERLRRSAKYEEVYLRAYGLVSGPVPRSAVVCLLKRTLPRRLTYSTPTGRGSMTKITKTAPELILKNDHAAINSSEPYIHALLTAMRQL